MQPENSLTGVLFTQTSDMNEVLFYIVSDPLVKLEEHKSYVNSIDVSGLVVLVCVGAAIPSSAV